MIYFSLLHRSKILASHKYYQEKKKKNNCATFTLLTAFTVSFFNEDLSASNFIWNMYRNKIQNNFTGDHSEREPFRKG